MPKKSVFPLPLVVLPRMFDVYVLKLAKRFQWSRKGFFQNGLGCLNFFWALRMLHPTAEHVPGCWWRWPGAHGRDKNESRRTGMLLPLPHGPPTVFSLHQSPIQGVPLWSDRTHVPPSLCRSVFVLTGWGRAIHCVGLDNYIFYVKQSQKLEQMPLWWQSERAAQFFLHSDIMKKGFWQNPFCPLNEVICLTKCTDSIQIIY